MDAILISLALALVGQVADGRYADAAATETAPAETAQPGDASAPATPDAAATASQITIPSDTPQPTLEGAAGAPPVDGNGVTDIAPPPAAGTGQPNPFDTSPLGASTAPPFTATPPTGSGATAAPPESSVLTAPKAADLMRALLKPPAIGQLPGVPLTLGAAVRDATTRLEQTERAKAYWDLSAAVAHYYLALQEGAELDALRQGIASPAAAWTDSRDDANRRIEITRKAATAAQLRLHRLMGATAGVNLPLPADSPHCGRYNTRYDEIFAARQDPAARQLNDLLPELHGDLTADARQIVEANDWLTFVSEHRDAANDGTGLLRAYELYAARERAFIDAVRVYNEQIAEYSQLAAPDQVGPDRLVAMLIRVSASGAAADGGAGTSGSGVQPASATDETPAATSTGPGGGADEQQFQRSPRRRHAAVRVPPVFVAPQSRAFDRYQS